MRDFGPFDSPQDSGEFQSDFPGMLEVLPDGREAVTFGEPHRLADFCHPQGDNSEGFLGTCGLCSVSGILNQFNFPASEQYVVSWAIAHGKCHARGDNPAELGGTTPFDQRDILVEHGVPASIHTEQDIESLADAVQNGRGIVVEVNAGTFWNDATYFGSGGPNHAITVTGVARDPSDGSVLGFYVNDTGTGRAAQFVTATDMEEAWCEAGGVMVATDVSSREYSLLNNAAERSLAV